MRNYLIAIGARTPAWIGQGFGYYARRLPKHCSLDLVEIPAVSRKQGDIDRIRREEGRRLLDRTPKNCRVIALAEDGRRITTKALAAELSVRMHEGNGLALLVGGADGLNRECRDYADDCWSLSALTFPHALVRVIVAEQMYRAWTILSNHPYHRE